MEKSFGCWKLDPIKNRRQNPPGFFKVKWRTARTLEINNHFWNILLKSQTDTLTPWFYIFLYLADDHVISDQYFVPQNKLYQRSPFIPLFDYYPSYIIWVKNYTHLFSIFDSTILQCKQKVDVGIYDPGKYISMWGVWAFD